MQKKKGLRLSKIDERQITKITNMICTAVESKKCPLAVVQKAKMPRRCFCSSPNRKPPTDHTNKENALSDASVTVLWINSVFRSWHINNRSNVMRILLSNNSPAHFFFSLIKQIFHTNSFFFLFSSDYHK